MIQKIVSLSAHALSIMFLLFRAKNVPDTWCSLYIKGIVARYGYF